MPLVARPVRDQRSEQPTTEWNKLKGKWWHLWDLPVKESTGTIDFLLGLDHAHLMAS